MLTWIYTLLSFTFLSIPSYLTWPGSGPTVRLDEGTFAGATDGKTNKFLGIPFAKPPTGDLRFRLPVANDPYTENYDATSYGFACPQKGFKVALENWLVSSIVGQVIDYVYSYSAIPSSSEDCLTLNVWMPSSIPEGTKLPVVMWFYPGGFGSGSSGQYDAGLIAKHAIRMGEPVVVVSVNYRLSAYGFLGGAEVKAAQVGNIGLHDQREAMHWVQKYISDFNGDPSKVTLWGESAGAISVALHMIANDGDHEGLFRAAFMQSGSPIPVGDLTTGQAQYDELVVSTGCEGAYDTLQCLREVDFETLNIAVERLSGSSNLIPWIPKVDGVFITDHPQNLVQNGYVADVPFISGDNDDEGTMWGVTQLTTLTEDGFRDFIHDTYMPRANSTEMDKLLELYPSDINQGSPFDTGIWNAITPQYKRLSAIQGDLIFQAPRRFFIQQRSSHQIVWSFLNKRLKMIPIIGSFHGCDLLNIFGGGELADYLINFVNYLDPNGPTVPNWPKYSVSEPKLMTFTDGVFNKSEITNDDFRQEAIDYLVQLAFVHPI